MSNDEKPPGDRESQIPSNLIDTEPAFSDSLSHSEGRNVARESLSEPVVAELIEEPTHEEGVVVAEVVDPTMAIARQLSETMFSRGQFGDSVDSASPLAFSEAPPIPEDMDNVAAVGGAVSAVVLGVWAIIGSLISPWSIVNSFLGFVLGMWGMTSRRRRWAIIGIVLCAVGFLLSTFQINELVQEWLRTREMEEDL